MDELLHAEGLAGRWSYPRSRIRMLLLENIHPAAVDRLACAIDRAAQIGITHRDHPGLSTHAHARAASAPARAPAAAKP